MDERRRLNALPLSSPHDATGQSAKLEVDARCQAVERLWVPHGPRTQQVGRVVAVGPRHARDYRPGGPALAGCHVCVLFSVLWV